MFFYQKELDRLNAIYLASKSAMVFLSGPVGVGKSHLLELFKSDKRHFYYVGRRSDSNLMIANEELRVNFSSWSELFRSLKASVIEKTVIIFDDFAKVYRNDPECFSQIESFYDDYKNQNVMIIIADSSEKLFSTLLDKEKYYVYQYVTRISIAPLKYRQLKKIFSNHPHSEVVSISSITGGVFRYINYFLEGSIEDGIIQMFFKENTIENEIELILYNELRDLSTYNTYLSLLAKGKNVLNELHSHTKTERAKISVYISNLIEIGVVYKDSNLRAHYYIASPIIRFYYRFIYPYKSLFINREPRQLYRNLILPFMDSFNEEHFLEIVSDYLQFQDDLDLLPFKISSITRHVQHGVTIDYVITDITGEQFIYVNTYYSQTPIGLDSFYVLNARALKVNRVEQNNYYYLFSKSGFTYELLDIARTNKKLRLVSLDDIFSV